MRLLVGRRPYQGSPMPVTLKCPDCGHVEESPNGTAKDCPACEGKMAPPKKKAPPKSARDEAPEPPAKKKTRGETVEDAPKPKKKRGDNPRDGAAAERAGLASGFDDAELMAQVAEELVPGEVLHFACRPARKLAVLQAIVYGAIAGFFALVPGLIGASELAKAKKSEDYLFGLIPLAVAVGAAAAMVLAPRGAPRGRMRQAARGWYAVTDRRAIVFEAPLLFGSGEVTAYRADEVRRMWVRKSAWLRDGGDVVFKTKVTITTEVSAHSEKTSKSTTHYGFIGVEDVDAVRDVIELAMLSEDRDD
jgi:hypothetical protein